jgi:ABC-2 type transport system permease protein
MIATIARKELVDMTRDGRFRLAAAAVALLLAAALAAGWRHWRDVSALHAAAQRVTREHWLRQPPKNAHSAAHYGVYAFKPEAPLSFVDQGVDSYVGVLAYLEAHRQNDFRYRPAQDATAAARFGEWTAAAVLQLLVPLVIVGLAFGAFAGERDQGTLRQLLALGVPPGWLALGKALGTAGALALLLVPAALAGALALVLLSGEPGDLAARVAALAGGYLAYFAVFVALMLALSARARSARAALVGGLAFWVATALVAPRVAADVARARHPAPGAFAFNAALERELAANPEGMSAEQRTTAFRDSVLRAYHVTSVDSLPVNFAGLRLAEGERHGDRVFDRAYGSLFATYGAQDAVRTALAVAAPLVAVQGLTSGLAGTDLAQHRDFQEAAERYRRRLVGRMNDALAHAPRTAAGLPVDADSATWASVPAFAYSAPGAGWVLRRHAADAAALALWVGAAAALLAGSLRRVAVDAEVA